MDRPNALRKSLAVWLLSLLAGAACGGSSPPPRPEGYYVEQGQLHDPQGQVLYLRGINVREEAKYHSAHLVPLGDAHLSLLPASGLAAVRLLVFWQAVMPARGQVDDDYLERLAAEAQRLDEQGLYVVLDMHQDLWGEPFGNGAPAWACPEELKQGYQPQEPWWLNYFSEQVSGCFDNFWADSELRDLYAEAWRRVAERLCGLERLVGFDLMNEPFTASIFGQSERENQLLGGFYQMLADTIEQVCPRRLFFLEPSRAADLGLGGPLEIPSRLRGRAVAAPHFYPTAVHEPGQGYDGDAAALAAGLDELFGQYTRQQVPVWIGEFGGLTGNPNFARYLVDLQQALFARGWAGALWAFSLGDDGFSFLDAAGERKPVFDDFCAVPVPVRLPAPARDLAADFARGSLELQTDCAADLVVELLLPGAGRYQVEFEPPGALEQPLVTGHLLSAACRGSGAVTLTVSAVP